MSLGVSSWVLTGSNELSFVLFQSKTCSLQSSGSTSCLESRCLHNRMRSLSCHQLVFVHNTHQLTCQPQSYLHNSSPAITQPDCCPHREYFMLSFLSILVSRGGTRSRFVDADTTTNTDQHHRKRGNCISSAATWTKASIWSLHFGVVLM